MKLTVISTDVSMSEHTVMLNVSDCLAMGVSPMDRVHITGISSATASVVISETHVVKGTVMMGSLTMSKCGADDGSLVDVTFAPMPESARSIRRKIDGETLDSEAISSIVNDIMTGDLSEKEILAFVSAFNVNNSDLAEVAHLTRAMAATGETVHLGVRPVFDFHSLGGVPGNKITPIVVSIVAAEGLTIPKLSSRAVSSACGTSDFVDTFCNVEMDTESLIDAIRRCKGVFACGNEDYAPVGNRIIQAERPMGIDPRPTMMASIMSKKVAIGTTHLLMDFPMGKDAKVPDLKAAESLANSMIGLGSLLGIHVECAITRADQAIGRAIGPILEARECIGILEAGKGDRDVVDKACGMAGIILEMAGAEDGRSKAMEVLESGKAHKRFLDIVEAQGGRRDLKSADLVPGEFSKDVHAKRNGTVQYIDSSSIVAVAKAAGAPSDDGAGVYFHHKAGDEVSEGDTLFTIYAESQAKLDRAVESARSRRPMLVSESACGIGQGPMVIARIPTKEMLDLIRFRSRNRPHGWRTE